MLKKAFALLLIVLLSGCTNAADPIMLLPAPAPALTEAAVLDAPAEAEPVTPRFGGTLRMSMRSPLTLNPLLNEDATVARVLQLMFEPLITFDEGLRPVSHLASLEFAFNGASVVVTIREGARWSDGERVTADDLIFSIQTLQNAPEGVIYKNHVENFSYLEIIDEQSVRITFGTISGGAAYLFNFPIIPRHHNDDMSPVGNGPFMFESLIPMESMRLVSNGHSFRGRPYIQEVNVLITADALTDLHAFDSGLTDLHLADVPNWARHHSVRAVRFGEHLAMLYEFIGFNFAREIPQIPYFRQAVAYTLDVEGLISDIFLTHATATRSPVHPASWLYEPYTHVRAYNMESARAMAARVLNAASNENLWPTDEEYEKLPLVILVNEENAERLRIARHLANQLNAIGLTVELLSLPFEDFAEHLQNGYFDLFVGGYNLSLQPDLWFAFHSESPENLLSYNDPELDRLLEAAAVSGTDSSFVRALSDIQLHIAQELPVISLAFRHLAVITDRRIQGDLRPSPDNIFINVHEWFIVE